MIKSKNMANSVKTHMVTVIIPAQAAGVDSADIPFFRCPKDITIVEVGILPQATYTGHADGSTVLVEVGSTAIATKTYTDVVTPPTLGTYGALGAVPAAAANRLEGDVLTYSITNGALATSPLLILQVEYVIDEVVD